MANNLLEVVIQAKDEVTSTLRTIQGKLSDFGSFAKDVLAGVGAAFGAMALGSFFKASIEEANQADQAYRLLKVSLGNIGVNAAAARPEIDKTVQSLARLTGQTDPALIGGLDRLIAMTGDYHKALGLLPLALDFAAARGLPLAEAVDLIGKTSNGSLTAIKKLGFQVTDSAEALQLLTSRFGGAAEAMANPLQRLAVAWDQVKEAMGRALLGSDNFGKGVNPLIDALTQLEQVIVDNQDGISAFVEQLVNVLADLVPVGVWIGTTFVEAWDGAQIVFIELTERFANIGPMLRRALGIALEAIGDFVAGSAELFDKVFGTHLEGLVDGIAKAGLRMRAQANAEIVANRNTMEQAEDDIFAPAGTPGAKSAPASAGGHAGGAAGFSAEALKSLQEQAKLAEKMAGFFETRVKGLTDLAALEQHINVLLKDRNLSDKDRVALLTEQAAIEKAQLQAGEKPILAGQEGRVTRSTPHGDVSLVESGGQLAGDHTLDLGARQAFGNPPGLAEIPDPMAKVTAGIRGTSEALAELREGLGQSTFGPWADAAVPHLDKLNVSLGRMAGDAITNLGTTWASTADKVIGGSEDMGAALKDLGGAAVKSVAQAAGAEGKRDLLLAAEAFGLGLLRGDPKAMLAAAELGAAGAGLLALSSALGGGGGGGGSPVTSGGGATGGLNPSNLSTTLANQSGDTLRVVVAAGYVDTSSADFQDFLATALAQANGRNVVVQYGGT